MPSDSKVEEASGRTLRCLVHNFLEAKTYEGYLFQIFTVLLICASTVSFILETVPELRVRYFSLMWIVEACTGIIFTVEYIARFWSCVEAKDPISGERPYVGWMGRLRWCLTYFAIVDLLSFVPFYFDVITAFYGLSPMPLIRIMRLERIIRVEGRLLHAIDFFERIFRSKGQLFLSASFVGITVWFACSSLYYLTERHNPEMIYCPMGPDSCYNRFESIPSSMYFCLLNLFGEFPLIKEHSSSGKFVATFVAIFAVAVFAIPTGIIGSAFEDMIDERKQNETLDDVIEAEISQIPRAEKDSRECQATVQRALNSSDALPNITVVAVATSAVMYYLSTCVRFQESAEFIRVDSAVEIACLLFFGAEYVLRVYAAGCDARYGGFRGRIRYVMTTFAAIDFLAVVPSLVGIAATSSVFATSGWRALRLLRLLKAERVLHSFEIFFDVIRENKGIFLTLFVFMIVIWSFCSTLMYYTEKNNPDWRIAKYYQSIPGAMWVTLLNLTGESPICDFTVAGKCVTAFMGIVGVGVFAVPIGLFGAAWEDAVESVDEEENDDDEVDDTSTLNGDRASSVAKETDALLPKKNEKDKILTTRGSYQSFDGNDRIPASKRRRSSLEAVVSPVTAVKIFVDGRTSRGYIFLFAVYALIFLTCATAILSTVDHLNDTFGTLFDVIELVAVVVFTVEYVLRVYASADRPAFSRSRDSRGRAINLSPTATRLRYVASYFALVDVIAVAPYYLAIFIPALDAYDEQIRMLRIMRLLKIESALPSLALLRDAMDSKRGGLFIAAMDTVILWCMFATLLYLSEVNDFVHGPDEDEPAQAFRYRNAPNSLEYSMIHLTGDFPLIDYTLWGRVTCFLIVIAAVGVTSVPQGLIASGFTDMLKKKRADERKRKTDASVTLQRVIRGYIQKRRFRNLVRMKQAKMMLNDAMELKTAEALEVAISASEYVHVAMLPTSIREEFEKQLSYAHVLLKIARSKSVLDEEDGSEMKDDDALRLWRDMSSLGENVHTLASPRAKNSKRVDRYPQLRRMYAILQTRMFKFSIIGLVALNVVSVLLESVPSIKRRVGSAPFDVFENLSVVVFTAEYVFRFLSARVAARYLYRRRTFFFSFYGIVDLVSIVPWYVMMVLRIFGVHFDAAIFRVFRVFRMLEFEKFVPAFTLLDDVYYKSKDVLKATGLLALIIWIGGATLFYAFQPELFGSIPNSMYFTAVFLGGEWGLVDYNIPNKVLTMVFCVIAIALFSIPVATLFEAFADTLEDIADGIDLTVLVKSGKVNIRATKEFSIGGLSRSETVGDLKDKIQGMCGIAARKLTIVFRGKELHESTLLGRVRNLRDGSLVRLEIPPDSYKHVSSEFRSLLVDYVPRTKRD